MTTFTNSGLIAGIDNSPFVRSTAGQGASGRIVTQTAWVQLGATDATTVVYRMIRVPTFAVIKKVSVGIELNGGTATTFTGSIGLYWSDAGTQVDGTPAPYVGSATPASAAFFAYQLAMAGFTSATGLSDVTFRNVAGNSVTDGFYVPSASYQPLWLALASGGAQGVTSGVPKNGLNGNFSGQGAVSSNTNPFYQISSDPGGMLDICINPTTTNSLSAAMYCTLEVSYVTGG